MTAFDAIRLRIIDQIRSRCKRVAKRNSSLEKYQTCTAQVRGMKLEQTKRTIGVEALEFAQIFASHRCQLEPHGSRSSSDLCDIQRQ